MRIEKDALGQKAVPDEAWYGIHTARSMDNFNVAGQALPLTIVYAIVHLKAACAVANVAVFVDGDRVFVVTVTGFAPRLTPAAADAPALPVRRRRRSRSAPAR